MSHESERFDVLVIGGGPAGQKAALQASRAGRRVLLVEKARGVGGECVHRGTIPSKTLRESALYLAAGGPVGRDPVSDVSAERKW